ncbi:MAG TPA: phosphoribosylamine--glycine ligase [Longimicrobiaceae bacterium]|nr:phosphoribosylamine--glycine ligase [Longimicrobiaceae bacterium]
MRILIVGNGGREHAFLRKLRDDAVDAECFITLGNGGTGPLARDLPLKPEEIQPLAGWALQQAIDLTVVGPEVPLAGGIVDHFRAQGLPIFGPTKAAAELESSKAFAKWLMKRHGIPTAGFEVFSEPGPAIAFVRALGAPIVVKASGLAAGKGAIVCQTVGDAIAAINEILTHGLFGPAGQQVVVEEFMRGEELSVFAISDGESVVTLLAAQDHKRVGEGDSGPNTGGMGAYAPVSIATPELIAQVEREILRPTIAAMAEENRPYQGILYAGLMITTEGPKVVEFNCRFGDPEAQVVLPLMESSLLDPMATIARGGRLSAASMQWKPRAAVTTVLASGGYPGAYGTGYPIDIPEAVEQRPDVLVFHAGTKRDDGRLVTCGGRVLAVTGLGATVSEAAQASRSAAEQIHFEGKTFRRDIGWREFGRA